eukprot:TRINITY_DN30279_c0_g1_i1.p1 TRINITY_DN30279_c0_g1~~TRINITY_DN30279_c0_g1_i1.p1  ORF type:complete len:532 (+),score=108.44 TRINITY_DN30279_c0_g1_i1:148-1596(+)
MEALVPFSLAGTRGPGALVACSRAKWTSTRHCKKLSAPPSEASTQQASGSILGTAASVAKGMVGSGVLSLSAGVAAFTRSPQGLLVAVGILAGMTLISAYTFQMVAEASSETGKSDFGDAWAASVGEDTAWMPRLAVSFISASTCVIYAMILGDLLATLLQGVLTAGVKATSASGLRGALLPWCSRGPVLCALTVGVLLPLCLVESFSNLAFTSILGLAACAYLAGFVALRYFDGSYAVGGKFFSLLPAHWRPQQLVPALSWQETVNAKTLVFLSNIGMAYMNHGMAPGTYQELDPGTPGASRQQKLRRYSLVTATAFTVAGAVCTVIMAAGFGTFGSATNGLLLANYSTLDPAAAFARVCVMVSVLFGFPLNFVLLRSEVASVISRKFGALQRRGLKRLTAGILAVNTLLAVLLQDLGVVQAAAGATLGSFIVYIAPALMSRGLRKRQGASKPGRAALEIFLIAFGVLLGSLGLLVTLHRK